MPDNPDSSGTYNWQLSIPECVLDAYERVDAVKYAPAALDVRHLQSARRSANIILQDWSGNRGVNLWAIGDDPLIIPMQPGVLNYLLPTNTIDLWDSYLRTLTPGQSVTLGNPLSPLLVGGTPVVDANGIPQITGPPSGVLSCVNGSTDITVTWPGHGLVPGAPVFFMVRPSIGAIPLYEFFLVDGVIDSNNFTIPAQISAADTETGAGLTPLFATTAGSNMLTVYLASHGLAPGSPFNVEVGTVVGDLMISTGTYPVEQVLTPYSFTIDPNAGIASGTTAEFENGGQFLLATQAPHVQPTDIFLWPISRNDYAMQPNKQAEGRPTSIWFNRTIQPSITMWPVPPRAGFGKSYYLFQGYRTRALQDFNLDGTQVPDMPKRFYRAFVLDLAADLASKFEKAAWPPLQAAAELFWGRAAASDVEHVTTSIIPDLQVFFS
jgi:hypothetical protein